MNLSLYKRIVLLAAPMVAQILLGTAVGFFDNVMVGQLGETSVAGVLAANQVNSILIMFTVGISASVVVLAAQYFGREDLDSAKIVVAIGFRAALAFGLGISATSFFFTGFVLNIFTNETAVITEGARYLRIVAFSFPFFAITQGLMAAMRCVQVVKISMYVAASTLIVSVFLNYALIFGNFGFPALGIEGAAIATLIARVLETTIMLFYVRFIDKRLNLRISDFLKKNKRLSADFVKYGLPVLMGDLLWGIVTTLHTAIMGRMGEEAMAAQAVSVTLFAVMTSIIWGVGGACALVIGEAVGKGDYSVVKSYARHMQLLFVALSTSIALIIFISIEPFLGLFDFTETTADIARQFMLIIAISTVFTGYHAPCFTGIIRAGGDTRFVLIVDAICAWLIVLPLASLAAFVFSAPPWVVFFFLRFDQFFKWVIAAIKTNRFKWIKNLTVSAE